MRLPLANKTLILIPVLFNMAIFARLAKPFGWENVLLAGCGVACTAVLGLAFCAAFDAAKENEAETKK